MFAAPRLFALVCSLASLATILAAQPAPLPFKPDLTVAADGSGDFKTIQAAVVSIPRDNRERRFIFVKDGRYHEKVRVDASYITLRGQSRAGTRLEFPQGMNEFTAHRDDLGQAVLNVNGDDFVLENFTVENTHGIIGTHAFTIYGRGDRTVIQDCDVFSQGNDTLSLWRTGNRPNSGSAVATSSFGTTEPNGRYYHARLKVRGSVDFICPRGWCYMTDSDIYEVNPSASAALWHDGSRDRDMKFVLRSCRFDGVDGWRFARHHADAQFFLLDCTFSAAMRDLGPYRVIYPTNGGPPSDADKQRNRELDAVNQWGERCYFFNCHRTKGDFAWHADNLASAPGAPPPTQITAKWTFAGKWDPENKSGPTVKSVATSGAAFTLTFTEAVTVKGHPRLVLRSGGLADYMGGSGTDTLVFTTPSTPAAHATATKLDFSDGTILASEAAASLRLATFTAPR